jgi:hypothetical protein
MKTNRLPCAMPVSSGSLFTSAALTEYELYSRDGTKLTFNADFAAAGLLNNVLWLGQSEPFLGVGADNWLEAAKGLPSSPVFSYRYAWLGGDDRPQHRPLEQPLTRVGKLRTVMVCRPGLAHQRLTPDNCHDLLFDDVIWVNEAQKDHYDFVLKMQERGCSHRRLKCRRAAASCSIKICTPNYGLAAAA